VTLASFNCSGAAIAEGLFLDMDAREGLNEPAGAKVRPQLDQLAELMCRGPRSQAGTYALPLYASGGTSISVQKIGKTWCAPQQRKRPIDIVLMAAMTLASAAWFPMP
jgi:hypothetical protein